LGEDEEGKEGVAKVKSRAGRNCQQAKGRNF